MKSYKHRKKEYVKTVLIVCIFVIVVVFTGYSLKNERDLTLIESAIKDIGVFITDTLYAPIKFVKDKVEIYNEKEDVYKKYKKLQAEQEDIDQKNARISELEKENKELKESLELNSSLSDYEVINATVVSRDVGYWYNKIVIDKGKKDGIETKMAVVINGGLIGYISETSNFSSNIQLLSIKTLKNKISVKIQLENGEYITGLLNGYDTKKRVYKIEGVSYSGDIPENAIVTTTGLSENFPSGIMIGNVKNITTDNFELGRIIEVSPSVDFENINYVTILKRKAASDDSN